MPGHFSGNRWTKNFMYSTGRQPANGMPANTPIGHFNPLNRNRLGYTPTPQHPCRKTKPKWTNFSRTTCIFPRWYNLWYNWLQIVTLRFRYVRTYMFRMFRAYMFRRRAVPVRICASTPVRICRRPVPSSRRSVVPCVHSPASVRPIPYVYVVAPFRRRRAVPVRICTYVYVPYVPCGYVPSSRRSRTYSI